MGKAVQGVWELIQGEPFPEYDGKKLVATRSADGKMFAGAAQAKGNTTLVYPQAFTAMEGDVACLEHGTKVNCEFSEDFYNVAVFISMDSEKVILVQGLSHGD
ncbi:hypothetical protein V2G26_019489 [Clonostachys chloroleuca]